LVFYHLVNYSYICGKSVCTDCSQKKINSKRACDICFIKKKNSNTENRKKDYLKSKEQTLQRLKIQIQETDS
jgi:hypothetical protein